MQSITNGTIKYIDAASLHYTDTYKDGILVKRLIFKSHADFEEWNLVYDYWLYRTVCGDSYTIEKTDYLPPEPAQPTIRII